MEANEYKKEDLTYEAAITRLEEIVATLEKGKQTLDGSVKLFEEGAFLAQFCGKTLQEAEQKLMTLEQAEAE